jgi:preprotein translocase subunit SecA
VKAKVVAKKTVTKKAPVKKAEPNQIETITPIDKNEFINLKMAKTHHENPREHAHEHVENIEEVEHTPLEPITREEPKVGRNDPCPCGSGLKYKKCHGK